MRLSTSIAIVASGEAARNASRREKKALLKKQFDPQHATTSENILC
jgi:hypothetical protein